MSNLEIAASQEETVDIMMQRELLTWELLAGGRRWSSDRSIDTSMQHDAQLPRTNEIREMGDPRGWMDGCIGFGM